MQFKPDSFKVHLHITAGERGGVCGQDPSLIAAVLAWSLPAPVSATVALAHKIFFPPPPGN